MNYLKKAGLLSAGILTLFLVSCADEAVSDQENLVDNDEVEIVYVAWDTGIATTSVIETVLEDVGYDVTTTVIDNAAMWQAIASDQADVSVSAWLPQTHSAQFEEHGDNIDLLGPNLEGAQIGYVVPTYMDVDSIEDLTDEADQTIVGIEAGSGTVIAAQEALEEYENLEDWTIQTSSTGAMTTTLGQAVENEEEIVVTGWTPHWKYQLYDLKFLDDPNQAFGDAERIETFVREDFNEDHPVAYSILENFYWEFDDIETVMFDIQEGVEAEEAARNWVDENQETVEGWIAEAEEIANEE